SHKQPMPRNPALRPPQAVSRPPATERAGPYPPVELGSTQPNTPTAHAPAVGMSPGHLGLARRIDCLGCYLCLHCPSAIGPHDATPARQHCSLAQRPHATRTPTVSARGTAIHGTLLPSADSRGPFPGPKLHGPQPEAH